MEILLRRFKIQTSAKTKNFLFRSVDIIYSHKVQNRVQVIGNRFSNTSYYLFNLAVVIYYSCNIYVIINCISFVQFCCLLYFLCNYIFLAVLIFLQQEALTFIISLIYRSLISALIMMHHNGWKSSAYMQTQLPSFPSNIQWFIYIVIQSPVLQDEYL